MSLVTTDILGGKAANWGTEKRERGDVRGQSEEDLGHPNTSVI